jgi:phosphate transport system permease protein
MVEFGNQDSFFYFRLPPGGSVLAGGLTLVLVILPVVIISSREALRAVPGSLREASFALGATRWQMVRRMILPSALPGIMTGAILSTSRAIGEAAPLLVVGGFLFITFTPRNIMDDFAAMPLQIFNWAGRPQEDFHDVAASGILVLLMVLLAFNLLAILVRHKLEKPLQ